MPISMELLIGITPFALVGLYCCGVRVAPLTTCAV
jgi:hypothetical protein